jgi:hypothetical protein
MGNYEEINAKETEEDAKERLLTSKCQPSNSNR